jgi:nucleotide-binding universal stress UspA family protein
MRTVATSTADDLSVAPYEFGSTRFAAEPVRVTRILVPLDGSPFAERALPVARWAAAELGAHVHVVEVATGDEDAEGAVRYVGSVTRRSHAAGWDVVQRDDVASALAEAVAAHPGGLACMATHGRDRSAGLLGSVAASLLGRSDGPVLLAGPYARAVTADEAPVVVAVDGTPQDDLLVPVALGWAAKLGRRLEIVTVVESEPAWRRGGRPFEVSGPAEPERYLDSLVARTEGAGVSVVSQVVHDPVSVREGLVSLLDRTAALAVLGSRHRPGEAQTVLGTHAARIVHDLSIPALAVPLPVPPAG